MAQRTLDLFKLLSKISQKDWEYVLSLTDEELKEAAPFVISRWLSGTSSAQQIYLLNYTVNPYVFELQKHKLLIFQLMTIATSGKSQRYTWMKLPGKQFSKPLACKVLCEYYGYSHQQAQEALPILSVEHILEYAQELGWQTDDLKKLNKELIQ